jgi:hypothetical protein
VGCVEAHALQGGPDCRTTEPGSPPAAGGKVVRRAVEDGEALAQAGVCGDAGHPALLPFPGVHLGVRVPGPRLRGYGASASAARSAARRAAGAPGFPQSRAASTSDWPRCAPRSAGTACVLPAGDPGPASRAGCRAGSDRLLPVRPRLRTVTHVAPRLRTRATGRYRPLWASDSADSVRYAQLAGSSARWPGSLPGVSR